MKGSGEKLSGGGREPGLCAVLKIRKHFFLRRQCQVSHNHGTWESRG